MISLQSIDIKNTVREYYQELYANIFDYLVEMDSSIY